MPTADDLKDAYAAGLAAARAVFAAGGTLAQAERAARDAIFPGGVMTFSYRLAYDWAMQSAVRDLSPERRKAIVAEQSRTALTFEEWKERERARADDERRVA